MRRNRFHGALCYPDVEHPLYPHDLALPRKIVILQLPHQYLTVAYV
jgi:hypothetical protein